MPDEKSKMIRAFVLSLVLLLTVVCLGVYVSADEQVSQPDDAPVITGAEKAAETTLFTLYVDGESGHISVLDKRSGYVWSSLPNGCDTDELAIGRNKAELQSALLLKYYDTEQGNLSSINSYASSVRKGGVAVSSIADGCRIVFTFMEEQLTVAVEVTLTDKGVSINVPMERIAEEGDNLLMDLTLYPFFGAADAAAEGYMLVPDGCGSLIHLNNGKTTVAAYSQSIYGRDVNIAQDQATAVRESILLPIFGMKNGTHGFLGVVTAGEALGKINAAVSGVKNSYNYIYTSYTIRTTDQYVIGKNSGGVQKSATIYQKAKPQDGNIQVNYLLLDGSDSSVGGMAAACREYMASTYDWKQQTEISSLITLNLVGATRKPKSMFGFPITGTETLTTFDQAREMLKKLQDKGVYDVQVRYSKWSNSGLAGKPQVDATPLSALGGQDDFKELLQYTAENGGTVFASYDPVKVSKWGNGYWRFLHAADTISGVAAFLYDYDLSTQQRNQGYNLLSYTCVPDAARKFSSKYKKLNGKALALETVGSLLASDFSVKTANRQDVCDTIAQTVETLSQDYELMVSGGALYVARYADIVVDLPNTDSGFSITDQTVPFYQMVIHGYKSYTSTAINLLDESDEGFLRAMETGGGLNYTWIAAEASALKNSEDEALFGAHAGETQMNTVAEQYAAVKELGEKTVGAFIVDYQVLTKGVSLTVYSNGVRTIVNHTTQPYVFEGMTVDGYSYRCL